MCTTWRCLYDIVAACESGLNTCSKPHLSSACVAQLAALRAATPMTGIRIPPVQFFLFFSLYIRSTLYSAYSVILSHLQFDSHFPLFSTANLSLDLAVHAQTADHDVWFVIVPSVCLSICDVEVPWSRYVWEFESNYSSLGSSLLGAPTSAI